MQARKLNPDAPEFLPSPARLTLHEDDSQKGHHMEVFPSSAAEICAICEHLAGRPEEKHHQGSILSSTECVHPPSGQVRIFGPPEISSEDTGKQFSPPQTSTTMSTAVCDAERSGDRDYKDYAAEDEDRDMVPDHLATRQSPEYKRPRYSRRVNSKSEPCTSSQDTESGSEIAQHADEDHSSPFMVRTSLAS